MRSYLRANARLLPLNLAVNTAWLMYHFHVGR